MSSTTITSPPTLGESQLPSNQPLLSPPPGSAPNFTNPPDHGGIQIVVTSILLSLAGVFFLNRVYIKTYIVRKYMWDDVTILAAISGAIAYYTAGVYGIKRGKMGIHGWDLTIAQADSRNLQIPAYLVLILPPPTFLFLKITFFIMYRQVFGPMRWMRICAALGAIFTTLFYTIVFVYIIIFTTSHKKETRLYHESTPLQRLNGKFSIPQSGVNLALNLYILVLPIVAVTKLQMAPRRKVGIILIFMTGLLACLGSILSLYYRVQLGGTLDQTWGIIPVMITCLVEMFVGIMCACMPAAAHTYHHHLRSYESLKQNNLHSRYRPSTSKDHSSKPLSPQSKPHAISTSRGVHEGYVSLDALEPAMPTPHAKSLDTFNRTGSHNDLDHDDIILTYELQQSSTSPPPRTGR